ncbi:hypothetical protein ACGF7W_26455 [Streptomyces sp. NPDC048219]|uniref:hypothetical protein n=1 Tax=Streptomyces sp. NPDC048219 TaxID=3365517 RepID=UPI00370FD794
MGLALHQYAGHGGAVLTRVEERRVGERAGRADGVDIGEDQGRCLAAQFQMRDAGLALDFAEDGRFLCAASSAAAVPGLRRTAVTLRAQGTAVQQQTEARP